MSETLVGVLTSLSVNQLPSHFLTSSTVAVGGGRALIHTSWVLILTIDLCVGGVCRDRGGCNREEEELGCSSSILHQKLSR